MLGLPIAMPKLPAWAWALMLVAAWGAWHRWRGQSAMRTLEVAKIEAQVQGERRVKELEGIAHEARQEMELRKAAADRARAQQRKLHAQVADLAARAAPACRGEADADPIGLLAIVLGRADERAGRLAEIADEARARGSACERAYDATVGGEVRP